jgi:hypothetical protein
MIRAMRRRSATWRTVPVIAVLGAALLAGTSLTQVSLARFVDTASTLGTFSADTLAPPTALSATGGASVGLTWTPTVDGYATGYTLLRGSVSGGPYTTIASVTPRSASSTTDSPGAGTWFYVLRSVYHGWQSILSVQAGATVGTPVTTAIQGCTATAADTLNAGDNDGYEGNPARACVDDGSAATDSSSGTGGGSSCGSGSTPSSTKDRHRFWGYTFGLPGTVSSITGITVPADLGMNNNGGTTYVCAQLSWDAGATWTDLQSVSVSGNAQSTYTLGSATDTWGHAWTVGQLAPAAFRVRIVDASSQSNKQFQLDFVGVTVSYYP